MTCECDGKWMIKDNEIIERSIWITEEILMCDKCKNILWPIDDKINIDKTIIIIKETPS